MTAALFLVVLSLLFPLASHARGADADALDRLGKTVTQNPDDPDLAWLWIRELLAAGENERATEALFRFVERWPERAEASARLGEALYAAGRPADALDALERAAELAPLDGATHFYRGLALRQLGRAEEARGAFRVAARLEPALEPEALLLAGISELELGETEKARALLTRVAELAPASESARQAQALLGGQRTAPAQRRRLSLFAELGVESDSNVTLEGETAPASTDESDIRAVWGAGLSYRVYQGERSSATLGYRYGESTHEEQKAYDLRSHTLFASTQWIAARHTVLRLDGFATDAHLDDDRYARTWSLRPNLIRDFGRARGTSRFYAQVDRSSYHRTPVLASLTQDGTTYTAGVEHYLMLPYGRDAWTALGLSARRTNTEAGDDLAGFDGAYDDRRGAATARAGFALPYQLTSELSLGYEYARYANDNVVGFLFEFDPDARRDSVFTAGLALRRPLTKTTELELRYGATFQRSNLETYTYDRHIVGLYFRARNF